MGCDIHPIVEYKPLANHSWIGINTTGEGSRYYTFFARIAQGVRGSHENAIPLKGIPNDASEFSLNYNTIKVNPDIEGWGEYEEGEPRKCGPDVFERYQRWGTFKDRLIDPDLHSQTWITFEEFEQALIELNIPLEKSTARWLEYGDFYQLMKKLKKFYYDVRLVISFDN